MLEARHGLVEKYKWKLAAMLIQSVLVLPNAPSVILCVT